MTWEDEEIRDSYHTVLDTRAQMMFHVLNEEAEKVGYHLHVKALKHLDKEGDPPDRTRFEVVLRLY